MAKLANGINITFKKLKDNKIPLSFYQKSAIFCAKNILGAYLVYRPFPYELFVGKIVEAESYTGVRDDASHAYKGKVTSRNAIMYEAGGVVYVYSIYGKYLCFNIIVGAENNPQAVFIRALEPLLGIDKMMQNRRRKNIKKLTNGPSCWVQAFGITKDILGAKITSDKLFLSRIEPHPAKIKRAKRIGIDYAKEGKDKLLRFYLPGSEFVSRR